jgi:hypothetical protein
MEFSYKVQFKNTEGVELNSKFTSPLDAKRYVDRLREEGALSVVIYRLLKGKESPTTWEFLKKEAKECRTSSKKIARSSNKSLRR